MPRHCAVLHSSWRQWWTLLATLSLTQFCTDGTGSANRVDSAVALTRPYWDFASCTDSAGGCWLQLACLHLPFHGCKLNAAGACAYSKSGTGPFTPLPACGLRDN